MEHIVLKNICVGAVIVGYKHGHCRIGRLSWENYQTLPNTMYCFYRPNNIFMKIPIFKMKRLSQNQEVEAKYREDKESIPLLKLFSKAFEYTIYVVITIQP